MNKKVLILGGGESGCGAAVLAKKKGWNVMLSDAKAIAPARKALLDNLGISYEENGHSKDLLNDCDLIIKSPGIPETAPLIKEAISKNISWEDEIEFAARYASGKTIGITGSNGKTTTTLWTYDIFKRAGLDVGLAGNVGKSWAAQLAEGDKDYWVLELSSFQIDGLRKFAPDVAVLCNITDDHLDRYQYKVENYAKSKLSLLEKQKAGQFAIINADDALTQKYLDRALISSTIFEFSVEKQNTAAKLNADNIEFHLTTNSLIMSIHDLALHGKHNVQNAMAAGIAANLLNIRKEAVRESLQQFEGIPHRLEFVASVHGIEFINDSKATNVNSTWWALESADKPVIWIVGGVDKGNDYSSLVPLVQEKVKSIICLGKENHKILEAFSGVIPTIVETASAKQAVETAYQLGKKGECVLLSPACASFDLFENYEDRGNQFKEAVRSL
ncbi:UDP-N-acetylmuramoyl-L-alanine--D-glutamate ligase [Luteibaculum oceani]|uniref:UDP-N-acetylmuramoylalanine--D-glutamate ligase n=1 Tax=Luteibaculum oceani TaxID=1294296 RepID=A0A5C6V2Z6_9FLAO|nr:UDP-N-acetylmuramoyl-L-alanine--D-glutamate ligase [Luteibaculum oceani]TXC78876.1 UDP-N-acetylmuramoyl-L-alanine--D-glutamate ligase [Luteibaculum oceani]